jgi:hypothetical protein
MKAYGFHLGTAASSRVLVTVNFSDGADRGCGQHPTERNKIGPPQVRDRALSGLWFFRTKTTYS